MTRRKKTRSLKQIHEVKTGSRSKLQKTAQNDRQHKGRYRGKNKQLSVYEQHVAAEKAQAVLTKTQQGQGTAPAPQEVTKHPHSKDKPALIQKAAERSTAPEPSTAAETTDALWRQWEQGTPKQDLY